MISIIRGHATQRAMESKVAWKALMRFFDRCDIKEEIRPLLLHVSYETYGEWVRRGYASRRGTMLIAKYIRLYNALWRIMEDDAAIRHWLTTPNVSFSPQVPVEYLLVGSEEHLDNVLAYAERFVAK